MNLRKKKLLDARPVVGGGGTPFSGLVSTINLISHWRMTEASGQRVDVHGTNNLTDNNTVGTAAGKFGNGADFIPANLEYLSIPNNAGLATGDIDFTVVAWAKFDDLSVERAILSKYDITLTANRSYKLSAHPSVGVVFSLNGPNAGDIFHNNGTPISTGVFHLFIAWHDSVNNQVGFVLDNGSPQTAAWTDGTRAGTAPLIIGGTPDNSVINSNMMDGVIHSVSLFKRMITPADRTALWNSGNGLPY